MLYLLQQLTKMKQRKYDVIQSSGDQCKFIISYIVLPVIQVDFSTRSHTWIFSRSCCFCFQNALRQFGALWQTSSKSYSFLIELCGGIEKDNKFRQSTIYECFIGSCFYYKILIINI